MTHYKRFEPTRLMRNAISSSPVALHAPVAGAKARTIALRTPLLRQVLVAGCIVALAIPALSGNLVAPPTMAADLIRLLRTMAVLKAAIALVSVGVVWWRFAFPVRLPFVLSYAAAAWLMAGGSVMLWQLTHLVLAAVVFHTGLAVVLLAAWRDNAHGRASASYQ